MLRKALYWAVFLALILHAIGFLIGHPNLPEAFDAMR
jgi:hypothetical protein